MLYSLSSFLRHSTDVYQAYTRNLKPHKPLNDCTSESWSEDAVLLSLPWRLRS